MLFKEIIPVSTENHNKPINIITASLTEKYLFICSLFNVAFSEIIYIYSRGSQTVGRRTLLVLCGGTRFYEEHLFLTKYGRKVNYILVGTLLG
jgi:hypothetical protein